MSPRWTEALPLALVLFAGAGFRTAVYLYPRSLYVDESMLALNIMGRGYPGLLEPLDLNQAAPVGFLWLLKSATLVWGPTELALRFFPWLASLASLPLFYLAVRRMQGCRCALLAVALLSLSPTALDYAGEAKQYAFDLLATVVVLLAVARHEAGPKPATGLAMLASAGALTLLFSHAVVFVTAGAGLALLGREIALRRWSHLLRLAPSAAIVLAAAAANYFLFLKPVLANDHLVTYWEDSLPPVTSASWPAKLGERSFAQFEAMLGLHLPGLGVLSLGVGLTALAIRGRSFWLAVIVLPLTFVIAAAAVDAYPFSERLLLFAIPLVAMGVASGAAALMETRRRWVRWAGWLLAYLLVGETVRHLGDHEGFLNPRKVQQIEPVLAYVSERLEPGDVLYVNGLAMATFRFYTEWTPHYPAFASHERIYGPHQDLYPAEPEENLARLMRHPRVWMIFTHLDMKGRAILDLLMTSGRRLDARVEPDAGALLFDLREPPSGAPVPASNAEVNSTAN